jgi:peptide/nickel transport system permease protein
MAVSDSFVILPLLPILILLSFLLRESMTLLNLAIILGLFGWSFDARLIRSQVLSLRERSFTRTAVYSGTGSFWITMREHLPFVLPIVFATTLNNILWSIGMEVILSVLGLSDLTTPTLGTALYWANQHGALVAGVWWWITAPALATVVLFLGLYLLFTSINEYIDPRTRLRLIGG